MSNIARNATLVTIATSVQIASADLMYTFDSDDQGWGSVNDTSSLTWDGALGNPSGALHGVDAVNGDIWFFSAPGLDLGDLSGLYANDISYDILGIRGNQTSIAERADIMLSGNGTTIGINFGVQPNTDDWTSWSVTVSDAQDWFIISNFSDGVLSETAATEAQILGVLSDLEGLYIRGEYTNGADAAAIDNVHIAPTPGAIATLALFTGLSTRRRRA